MSHDVWQVIKVSLQVALCSTLLVMVCSIFLATAFVHCRSRIIRACEVLIYVPMAMPPVALGYGLLLLLGPRSWLGKIFNEIGVHLAFTFAGAVVASFVVSLGIGVRTLRLAQEQIDVTQLHIAQLLGASKITAIFYIVLPQCVPALLGGAILVFIRSVSEFGATMILAGNTLGETRTLALAIWIGMETPGKEGETLLLMLLAAMLSLLALLLAEVFLYRNKS